MGRTAHRRVQAEAMRIGAQGWCGRLTSAGDGLQAQHLLSRAWPQGNAVGARGRLQGRERLIGLDAGQITHALLLDEHALTSEQPHEARDDFGE